jgi:polysaccharide biosynthesis protein PelA
MVDGHSSAVLRLGFVLFVILLGIVAGSSPAIVADEQPEPILRHVLALFDSEPGKWLFDVEDPVHQNFELPLQYLGMVLHRHDIRKGPPPPELMQDLRAVLTAFDDTKKPVEWLWPWLEAQRANEKLRFIHLGEFGPLNLPTSREHDGRLTRWLTSFGLGFDQGFTNMPMGIEVKIRDRQLCALEADPKGMSIHHGPWIESRANTPWITTRCTTGPGRTRAPVLTGPWGGLALAPYIERTESGDGTRRQFLDLFAFFKEALGLEGVPAPHPCVLNGRRMFFCHVDGDGYESISLLKHGAPCGEVLLEQIVERYQLPFTISVIVASLTDDIAPDEPTELMKSARRFLSHPRVEAGTHTVLHPLTWSGSIRPEKKVPFVCSFPRLNGYSRTPRGEVRASVEFIERYLLPEGKRCGVMLWSGNCVPPPEAIDEADKMGVLNINGGDFRWDALHDSIGYVTAWGRLVDGYLQVYCGAPNEVIYEGFFDDVPSSFRHVDKTIERTGTGRILKPADIYLHHYSAERPARLRTVRRLLERWGQKERTAPVFASTYIKAVRSALLTARMLRTREGFQFRDFGDCRTVRIDNETREVDFARSPGILGAYRQDGSLYLHLSASDAEVVLVPKAAPAPHVLEANHLLDQATRDARGIAVTSAAVSPRLIVFAGFPPETKVLLIEDGTVKEVQTNEAGQVEFRRDEPGSTRVEVRLP